jgi:hypothetical protein
MYASKKKKSIHDGAHQKALQDAQKNQGDPILGAAGSIAGSAIGGAVGGPMGAQLGGSIGGQLGGTGEIDLTKTATGMATGAIGGELTNALSDTIGETAVANAFDTGLGSDQTKMLWDQQKEFGMGGFFNKGGPISYHMCGGKAKYKAEGGPAFSTYSDNEYSNPYSMSNNTNVMSPKGSSPKYSLMMGAAEEVDPYAGLGRKIEPWEQKDYRNEQGMMGKLYDNTMNKITGREQGSHTYGWGDLAKAGDYFEEGGSVKGDSWVDNLFSFFKNAQPAQEEEETYGGYLVDSSGNRVTDGSGNAIRTRGPLAAPVTKAPQQVDPYETEEDEYDDMGDASYLAGDPAPYSVQTYRLEKPAPRRRPTPLMPTYGESMGIPEGGDEWTDIDVTHEWKGNNKMMPSYTPNHVYYQTPGQDTNKYKTMDEYTRRMKAEKAQREAGAFSTGGNVGPLKSVKYKSSGGNVSEKSYYNPYGK